MRVFKILSVLFWLLVTSIAWGQEGVPLSPEQVAFLKKHQIEVPRTRVVAENFQGILIGQKATQLSDYRGKLIMLNFWATWCSPCRKEMPDMESVHKTLQALPFSVLAVAMGENEEQVSKFLQKHPHTFPVLPDPDMKVSLLYGVRNIPVTYLISPQGVVIGRAIGPREWADPELVAFFKSYVESINE